MRGHWPDLARGPSCAKSRLVRRTTPLGRIERASRLYEQKCRVASDAMALEMYVKRWMRWTTCGRVRDRSRSEPTFARRGDRRLASASGVTPARARGQARDQGPPTTGRFDASDELPQLPPGSIHPTSSLC